MRQPALEKLILSRRPTQLAYSRRLLRTGSPACAPKPRLDDFLRIAPKNRWTVFYHILSEKRKFPNAVREL
jgi:hypothetical protein